MDSRQILVVEDDPFLQTLIADNLTSAGFEVKAANNGQYLPENQAGLGTRILDEISTGWDRVRTPEGTLVTGQIAVIPKEPQNPLISRV